MMEMMCFVNAIVMFSPDVRELLPPADDDDNDDDDE